MNISISPYRKYTFLSCNRALGNIVKAHVQKITLLSTDFTDDRQVDYTTTE